MTKQVWAYPSRMAAFLTTFLCVGFAQTGPSFAQTLESEDRTTSGSRLIPGGSAFTSGILPPVGTNGIGNYFSGQSPYSVPLGNEPDDGSVRDQYWLELDSSTNARQGVSAQIGVGYSPSPDLGFAVGSFLDLDAASSRNIGVYQTGGYAVEPLSRRVLISNSGSSFNDAGLAASLSYMPLEDIWIGLHGSVSRNLTPTTPDEGVLDGIDAMLGLTASYRIEF
ncbi:MAG: hypothetical protein ACFHHU_18000 [Porticoccaceae bacterium]|uniref:hypothetical protein n=1 Tax=Thalassospira sp. TaxID=1912094 RepID=UPI003A8A676B